ncbi:MAG: phosphatase PAP2 family protein [Bacteroidota bacterium]|nr:phosphatase PAP2 family protein [Bacteroidota bacterium]
MIEKILDLDSYLFLFLNNLGSQYYDNFWIFLSRTEANVIVYLVILIAYIYSINNKKRTKILFRLIITIAILITISDQTSNLFKDSFQRLRPCYNELISDSLRLVKDSCGGRYGFFSAHASNSFSLAIFFGLLLRSSNKLLILLFAIYAFLISYSRIYLGVHYPIDIIVGIIFGTINAIVLYKIYLYSFNFLNKS